MKKVVITRFEKSIIRLAGFSPQLIERTSEAEKQRVLSLALILMVPVSIGVVSAGYAAYFLTQSPISWLIGFLWGAVILIIDRSIISIQKSGFWVYALRFLIAVIVGLVISFPLKLAIFQDVISEHQANVLRTEKNLLDSQSKQELARVESMYNLSRERTYNAKRDYLCEIDGTCGTGHRNEGPIALRKLSAYLELKQQESMDSLNLVNKRVALQKDLNNAYLAISSAQAKGLIGMWKSVSEIAEHNPLIKFASYLIWAFLTLLELLPLFVKIQNQDGLYEKVLTLDADSILVLIEKTNEIRIDVEFSKEEIPLVQSINDSKLKKAESIIDTELHLAQKYSAGIVQMTKNESDLIQTLFSMKLKESELSSIFDKVTSIFTKYTNALHEKAIKVSPADFF